MKKLYKLTILSFIGPFIITFFVVLFILLMQFLFKYIDDLVGKGLEWYVISELLFYASATFVPLALPLAILLSSIMTFGNLAEHFELTAFKSAGVSLMRILVPLIILVTFISGITFYFANTVIPKANLKFGALLWDVRQQKPALDIREGIFYNGIEGYSIRVAEKAEEGRVIRDVMIYDHTAGKGNTTVLTAEEGRMWLTTDERWLMLKLFNGTRYEELEPVQRRGNTQPASRVKFGEYELRFDLSTFTLTRTNEDLFKDHYQMLNLAQLQHYKDSTQRLINRKSAMMQDFLKPYFRFLGDTIYLKKSEEQGYADSMKQKALVRALDDVNTHTLNRAINTAKSARNIIEINQNDMENYQMLMRRYSIEFHRKFVLSGACLLLFFIGAPLGAIIRKGGLGMPTLVSVFLFIFFHILTISFEKSTKQGLIEPWLGMWAPIFILVPISIFLTYKANRDSILFTTESYKRMGRNLVKFFKKKTTAA